MSYTYKLKVPFDYNYKIVEIVTRTETETTTKYNLYVKKKFLFWCYWSVFGYDNSEPYSYETFEKAREAIKLYETEKAKQTLTKNFYL